GRERAMTGKTMLVDVGPGETRIAFLEEGRPAELAYERAAPDDEAQGAARAADSLLGRVYLGRVKRVLPGMQAAFVAVGEARNGFLSARDGGAAAGDPPPIGTLVHEGQALLVQVIKDPIGEKGARLSAQLSFPGRLVILVPGQALVALSRRI